LAPTRFAANINPPQWRPVARVARAFPPGALLVLGGACGVLAAAPSALMRRWAQTPVSAVAAAPGRVSDAEAAAAGGHPGGWRAPARWASRS